MLDSVTINYFEVLNYVNNYFMSKGCMH